MANLSFPTTALLLAFPFKTRHVGMDVYDTEADTMYAVIAAGSGAGVLSELTGSGGAFTPSYYSGHDATDLAWSSTTWSGVHNALSITDVDQEGITRSNSTWTFAEAGEYVLHLASPALRTVTASIGVRARVSGATVGGPQQSTTNDTGRITIARLHKRLTLAAAAEVTLEYCVTSAFASVAAASLDGETGHTCDIEMYRIS